MTIVLGFIGFGEAGSSLARGFAGEGLSTRAYDILLHDPVTRPALLERAGSFGATLVDSVADMVAPCTVVVSAVVASSCLAVAERAAEVLTKDTIYLDINSVAPAVKRKAQSVIERHGGRYVDAGVMAAVPTREHRVPMLLAGAAAPELVNMLAPTGTQMEVLSRTVGDAAAAKMFQSILIKGTEALLLECLIAASRQGVERLVLDSMSRSTPGMDWVSRANYMLGRTAKHGTRRAEEMDQVAATLEEMGIEPMMARGAAERLHWAAERSHGRPGMNDMPGYRDVIAILRAAEEQ